jgi:hypothetical protein
MGDAMVLALSFLLGLGAAGPAGWTRLFEEADETTFIEQSHGARRTPDGTVWIRHDYARPRAGGIRSLRDQWQVSCARRTFTMYALVSYDSKGRILRAQAIPPEERQAAPVVPGSRMERVFRAVCG